MALSDTMRDFHEQISELQDNTTVLRQQAPLNQQHMEMSSEEILKNIRPKAQDRLRNMFRPEELGNPNDRELRRSIREDFVKLIAEYALHVPKNGQIQLAEKLMDDLLGFGPLEPFFSDPDVTEIKVIKWDTIRVEKNGKEILTQVKFRDEQHCRDVLDRMIAPTGRRVDLSSPRVSARLPDGSRLMAHIPPIAVEGTTIRIIKHRI